jgi:hypothetical protein
MAHKLFIIHPGNESLFRTLNKTLDNELDVVVIYDRRDCNQRQLRGTQDRRVSSNVQERIRTDGFAVVRPISQAHSDGNIRWSA